MFHGFKLLTSDCKAWSIEVDPKTLRLKVLDDPRRQWQPRTPAMAAGLTNHIWTVKELLTVIAPPNT